MQDLDRIGFLCRVQPPHVGHINVIKQALLRAKDVYILIGSARSSRSITNPFTYQERVDMVVAALKSDGVPESDLSRIQFRPLKDDLYNMERWVGRVQEALTENLSEDAAIGIISSDKNGDDKLRADWFPYWDTVSIPHIENLHATDIRVDLFSKGDLAKLEGTLNTGTIDYLKTFQKSEAFDWLVNEWETVLEYKKPEDIARKACQEAGVPYYGRTYHTSDAVVFCSGHVLMITRKSAPGKGLLALPGGYLNMSDTTSRIGALRELKEETKIDVPLPILDSNVFDSRTFDHKSRDVRGRLITSAFAIHLPRQASGANGHPVRNMRGLPKVRGADDAVKAEWVPLSKFREGASDIEPLVYADHFSIIQYFLGRLENAAYK